MSAEAFDISQDPRPNTPALGEATGTPPLCGQSLRIAAGLSALGLPSVRGPHSRPVDAPRAEARRGLHGAIALRRQAQAAGRPWRLAAADYLAGPAEGEPFRPDQVPDTPWDPALADAMRQRCERVSEEARLADLIADMQRQVINDAS
jgi:hypothetical protein